MKVEGRCHCGKATTAPDNRLSAKPFCIDRPERYPQFYPRPPRKTPLWPGPYSSLR